MTTMAMKAARHILTPLGVSIKKNDYDEFVVNLKGGKEATTYYTNDIEDAVNTGMDMAKRAREYAQATFTVRDEAVARVIRKEAK